MKRKTPIRHKVKKHTRRGKPVRSHSRGKGSKKSKVITRRRIIKDLGKHPKVTFLGAFPKDQNRYELRGKLLASLNYIKKEMPKFHEVFADDIKELVIVALPTFAKILGESLEEARIVDAFKDDAEPDRMYIQSDFIHDSSPKEIATTVTHEIFHGFMPIKDTMEEEALAYKTEVTLGKKIGAKGMPSDKGIRRLVV